MTAALTAVDPADVRPHDPRLSPLAGAALPGRRAARRPPRRTRPPGRAARAGRCGGVDRALATEHLRPVDRAVHARRDGRARARRLRARSAAAPEPSARAEAVRPATVAAGARLRRRARAGPLRRAHDFLGLRRPDRLRLSHDGRRLPDPSRPGLRPPRPDQLLRPVHPALLRHGLPVGRRHAVRRQRIDPQPAADLDLPAVQRLHARAHRVPDLAARAPRRLAACLARARDADRKRPRARLRLRADRVGQGDQRAAAADGDRRTRDARRPLAARLAAGRAAVRAAVRRRPVGPRPRLQRLDRRDRARARRHRHDRDHARPPTLAFGNRSRRAHASRDRPRDAAGAHPPLELRGAPPRPSRRPPAQATCRPR